MKKIALFTILVFPLFFISITFASSSSQLDSTTNHFYIGPELGYSHVNFAHKIQEKGTNKPEKDINDITNSINGGFVAGYSWQFTPRYFLASEIYWDYNGAKQTYHGHTTSTTKYYNYDYGLQLHPGIRINQQWSAFLTLGMGYGHFRFKATGNSNVDKRFDKPGYLVGFGGLYSFRPNLRLRVNYEYNRFDDATGFNETANNTYNRTGYAATNQLNFAVLYYL